jgi:hypothetical protein
MIWANFSLIDFYLRAWKTPYPDAEQRDKMREMIICWHRPIQLRGKRIFERTGQKPPYGI